ncbi:hypothetical protein MUN74_06290 [Agromyces endophyticus]|uniref:hypothetical protein n=1 Tax=Agromyces sp. H17E-10 TaxID=2932244 RepID=UPI001FD14597|nr:hypothetical protein [Agromyces sp. H17E-10]UOQ90519.1 hypothetical protein MUN74_06290 [Agromyces sp. H17E-10]
MTTIHATATAAGAGAGERARSSSPGARLTVSSGVRAVIAAVALLCVGIHVWVAVAAPDWRSLAMLGLAAACAVCLLHRGGSSLPSTGEWGFMAVTALAMLVVHFTGAGAVGHHAGLVAASDGSIAVDQDAAGTAHSVAGVVAAAEFGAALLALTICGVRRRAGR